MWGDHHLALLLGYGSALAAWTAFRSLAGRLWPAGDPVAFSRAWLEVGYALLAAIGVIALGQLYLAGFRLSGQEALGGLLEALNQVLIFSPFLLLLWLRKQPLASGWLPTNSIPGRMAAGVALAALATLVFTLTRTGADPWWAVAPRLLAPAQLQHAPQVFMEDFAIAVLLCRLGAALPRAALAPLIVAALFSLGHLPALLQQGAGGREVAFLVADFALAFGALRVVQASRDITWFFFIHYSLDMMQFQRVSGVSFAASP